MNFDPPENLPPQTLPNPSSPPQNPSNPTLVTEPSNDGAVKMDIEPSPLKQPNLAPKTEAEFPGKQSPMKPIKASPNKQEVTNFNQPEEHITIIFSSFKDAIRNADISRLKEILQKYQERYDLTNRLDPVTKHISTFLASEVKDDQKCFEVLSLLLKFKANVHFIDSMKQSILFYLAKEGHIKCLEMVLAKGLNPEDSDVHGQTPIYYAARDGKNDVIRLLIQWGADVNHKDNISNQTCLFYAARDGRYEACKIILENGGLASHMDNKKQTPLHWAKRHNKKEVIELLQTYTQTSKHDSKNVDKNRNKPKQQPPQHMTVQNQMHGSPMVNPVNNNMPTMITMNNISAMNTMSTPPMHSVPNPNTETPYIDQGNDNNDQMQKPRTLSNHEQSLALSEEKSNSNLLKKRKREKYEAKICYKLVYTDDFGKSTELTNADFEKFKDKYPQIAEMMLKADSMINENLIKENKEKETWEKVAKRILNNVWKLKGAFYFHAPVDPIRLKIEDYFDIVKKPMDFGTIKTKLNTNVYKDVQEFIYDTNLVFSNCVLYNGSESEVGKIGLAILREFEGMIKSQHLLEIAEDKKEGNYRSMDSSLRKEESLASNVI